MSRDAQEAWRGLLAPDERIVWQGRPATRLDLKASDIPASLFGTVFLAFSLFWIATTASFVSETGEVATVLFPLAGIPFLFAGAYLMVGRFFWDARRRARTWYTLTDRRAFVATDIGGKRTLEDYEIGADADFSIVQRGALHTVTVTAQGRSDPGGGAIRRGFSFDLIPDGRDVYSKLLAIREAARARRQGREARA